MAEKKKPKKPGQPAEKKRTLGQRLLRRREPAAAAAPVEARASGRYILLSPQKARLVIDLIRGQQVGEALTTLRFTQKRAARPIEKVLRSALANAEQKSHTVDVDRLYVARAVVNEGPRLKRIRPAPFGRAYGYVRRMSHIEISVAERRAAVSAPAAAPASST